MELPPQGWYPDPYQVPGLLRWWDGSVWTHHTIHAGGGADATDGAEPGKTAQPTSLQPTIYQAPVTSPPPVTAPQPSVTAPQPPVTSMQPTIMQPGVTAAQGLPAQGLPAQGLPAQGHDGNGTQVLFLGDNAWSTPGGPGGPGGPGPAAGDQYGYYRAQRQRRMWLMGGLAAGTAAVLGVIALVVSNLGNSHPAAAASKPPSKPAVTTPPPSPSPTASPTQPAAPLTDTISGLSYPQLPAPWQAGGCPGTVSQGFTWSAGESAIAGQVNGGQTTWYGEACSAPLPQQFGYNGVQDLENVTTNLVNQFTGADYNALPHGFQQELSQPVTVSGHAGWQIKYLISYQNAQADGLPFTDEEGEVVVADLGTGAAPAVFFASIPANLGESNVDSLVSSLQLSTPQPGTGGSPSDGSPGASGSPSGGDGGDQGGG